MSVLTPLPPNTHISPKSNKVKKLQKRNRQLSAEERETERWARTDKEQIEKLDEKLGKGKGAVKERKRLNESSNDKARQSGTAN